MLDDVTLIATDGSLMLAIPAFAPALVIAGVVIVIAMRSRRRADDDGQDEGT